MCNIQKNHYCVILRRNRRDSLLTGVVEIKRISNMSKIKKK